MTDNSENILIPVLRVSAFVIFFVIIGFPFYRIKIKIPDTGSDKKMISAVMKDKISDYQEPGKVLKGFRVTAYCPGKCCNGRWHGQTASGKTMDYYAKKKINIAAVDPEVIPLGTWFRYGGSLYFAADTGGYIKGMRIDIFMNEHEDTVKFGVRYDQALEVMAEDIVLSRLSGEDTHTREN